MKYVRCKVFEADLKELNSMVLSVGTIWVSEAQFHGVNAIPTVCIMSAAHDDVLEFLITPELMFTSEELIDYIMSRDYTNLDMAAATFRYSKYDVEAMILEYEAVYNYNCKRSAIRKAHSFK
mgnify:CR=1 FL=1